MTDIKIIVTKEKTTVEEENYLQTGLFIEIITDDYDEYFEIYDNSVQTCESQDIDLNSQPTLTKIINYIENNYGVEI